MNTYTREPLDNFDAALLARLQQEVVTPRRRPARRRVFGLAGVAAAASAAIIGVTTLGSSTAAYAVDRTSAGDITITIHQLSDAAGLQKTLASYGIKAAVNYQPTPTLSGPNGARLELQGSGSGGKLESGGSSATLSGSSTTGTPPAGTCGDPSHPPLSTQMNSDDYVITIPSNSPLHNADSELKITTTGDLSKSVAGINVNFSIHGVQCGLGSMSASAVPAN